MARHSLLPREHGAYAQLAIPLLAACLQRVPTPAMILLSLAACLAFCAYEPFLVMLGHRGPRRRERDGARARVRLAVLAGGAVALGVTGLWLAPSGTIVAAALIAAPIAVVIICGCVRATHTVAGELIAAIALTGASAVVMVAGGATRTAALATWLAWSLGFGASVLAVHRVIARHKRTPVPRAAGGIDTGALGLAVIAALAVCLGLGSRCGSLAIAAPLLGLAAVLAIAPPSAKKLRAIGIAIVAAGVASAAVELIGIA
jgi:hypothetical protein